MSHELRSASYAVDLTHRTYQERRERAAARSGMGDAATLCDAIAQDLLQEMVKGGTRSPTKAGLAAAAIAKRCGDAIWAMRQNVKVPQDSPAPPGSAPRCAGGR